MNNTVAIKVTNLSKVFPLRNSRVDEDGVETNEHWALKDVSFEIKKGESVGIIGPNGSGKSTLLKILAGVTKPTSGKVEIRGKVASILDIGAGFHPELSGRENVYLNGQIHGFSKKEIEAKFDEIVAFSGIEKFIDEPVKNYSNGMYLRLAFSIMAHLDFDVYLFDEVLSVGDAEFQNKCIERITEITKHQKTVVVVYHNLIFADKIVNREIDIHTVQKEYQSAIDVKYKDVDYFDDEILIPEGILNQIRIPYTKMRFVSQFIVLIKSSTGISLATSKIINNHFYTDTEQQYTDIIMNTELSSGIYILNIIDTQESSENIYKTLYTVKINVPYNKFYKSFGNRINSVLILKNTRI